MAKNSYVLGKRIARGGIAEIYLGKAVGEAAFQKIVAIKRILPHYAGDKEFIEMFRDEAHICKRLQHNNIVQVYDFTEVDGSYALIMEHVDGADLRTLLSACEGAKTRLSVPMSLYIAASAARALHYAHTKNDEITNEPLGIVHRDISPQNILISYEGDVKITDFGIASAENKLTETRPGVVKGKYSYMSPEQVAAKQLDGRSDVFSLAIVLWETLAMKRLFAGMTEVESIRKVQNCEIPYDICELNPEVDGELRALLMKGLSKDRKQRYQTAAAFEKDLLRYLHSKFAEFTSRELGNFLKRILAKRRDRTQDDIKETLAQATNPVQAAASATVATQSQVPLQAAAGSGLAMDMQADLPKALSEDSALRAPITKTGESRSVSALPGDDRMISLTTGVRKTMPPRAGMPGESSFRDGGAIGTSTRTRPRPVAHTVRHSKRKGFPVFLFLIAAFVGALYYLKEEGFFESFRNTKKLQVELTTVPEVVSLKVNGVALDGSTYKHTPVRLYLAAGTYEIEISHPGFQKETIRISGAEGEPLKLDKIFLKRLSHVDLVPVRVESPGNRWLININDGLFEGETPLRVDLLPDYKHSMTFRSQQDGKYFRCEFTARRNAGTIQPIIIIPPPQKGAKARCLAPGT